MLYLCWDEKRQTSRWSKLRLFVLALLTSSVLLGQKYEVRLTPRNRAGDVFLFKSKGSKFQRASIAGQVMKQEEVSAEFEGTVEVLDVDSSAEPFRLAFTVSKFTKSQNGASSELLKSGSVVLVDGGAGNPVSLKGGELSDEARKAFDVIYSPHTPGSATDDDVFGTKEPKALGDRWPINAKLAAEDAKRSGIEIPPDRLKGSTELVSKDSIGGADCLSVRADLMASGVTTNDLPAGATMDEGTVDATFDGCVATSGSSSRKRVDLTLKARLTINASTIELEVRQKSSQIWQEIPK